MNKAELKEQLQENLLTYFNGAFTEWTYNEGMMDDMCNIIIKTIDEHD